MVEEHEDLRLSLSLNSFQHYHPSKQTLFNIQCKKIIHHMDVESAKDLSPVSTLSNINGKRIIERDDDPEVEDQDGPNSPKKLRLSKQQTLVLEQSFTDHKTLNPRQKAALAKQLNLKPRQVEVWFQNRRARTKLKQTEVECEYLKKWCQKLAEENKRLQKEVRELRALKTVAVSRNMQPMNLATLVTCNSCESSIAKSTTHVNPWASSSYFHREAS